MNARTNTFEFNCLGPEVNEIVSSILHSIVFYRCYGKFHYKEEDSYCIGTLGYEEVSCDFIDFTYVRISSPQLIEYINKEIKDFVDKLRQDNSQSNGAISIEFSSRRRGRWPFNDAPLVWEIWTIKVNCDRDKDKETTEKQQKVRIEELLLEKLVTIVQIMNGHKSYLPQMPNQLNSDSIFDTNYTDVQPYIFKISHKVGAAANPQLMATQGSGDGSAPFAIKKFIRETLAL